MWSSCSWRIASGTPARRDCLAGRDHGLADQPLVQELGLERTRERGLQPALGGGDGRPDADGRAERMVGAAMEQQELRPAEGERAGRDAGLRVPQQLAPGECRPAGSSPAARAEPPPGCACRRPVRDKARRPPASPAGHGRRRHGPTPAGCPGDAARPQLAAMSDQGDAQRGQIVGGKLAYDTGVDVIVPKRQLVPAQPQPAQPSPEAHSASSTPFRTSTHAGTASRNGRPQRSASLSEELQPSMPPSAAPAPDGGWPRPHRCARWRRPRGRGARARRGTSDARCRTARRPRPCAARAPPRR